jgi:flagellar basal-body rod modification protein FlgD
MVNTVQSTPSNTGTRVKGTGKKSLKAEDFINLMVKQLQQQDPMEPAKNSELLAQMSQVASLQSNTSLQESLSSMMKQSQLGSAAGLIGKSIEGLDANDDPVKGRVTSIRVVGDSVDLELDTGKSLALNRVTIIAPPTAAGTPAA